MRDITCRIENFANAIRLAHIIQIADIQLAQIVDPTHIASSSPVGIGDATKCSDRSFKVTPYVH